MIFLEFVLSCSSISFQSISMPARIGNDEQERAIIACVYMRVNRLRFAKPIDLNGD